MLINSIPELHDSTVKPLNMSDTQSLCINEYVIAAWKMIAPFWPLKNLIAANPLQGLEDLPFEEAIVKGAAYFQQKTLPAPVEAINRETIKWCQSFFDDGQATISMPFRDQGLYQSWKQLVVFDKNIHKNDNEQRAWLKALPSSAETTISMCLDKLKIETESRALFLTLSLTTLPGWASYIKYRTEWTQGCDKQGYPVKQADYLAMRLVITCIMWPNAIDLLSWYEKADVNSAIQNVVKITQYENAYHGSLFHDLSKQDWVTCETQNNQNTPAAQFVFCIDVRSEPFRRALEMQGNYETFGYAGFFGIPTQIKNELTGDVYPSCPVLLNPKHVVEEKVDASQKQKIAAKYKSVNLIKRIYLSLKYTFTTPLMLVELLGPLSGIWMLMRTLYPKMALKIKRALFGLDQSNLVKPSVTCGIEFKDQCDYAENALRMIGLTKNFSQMIVLCGHGSATQNNAYATALDCGACGGHQGAANARILADILNNIDVRKYLESLGIKIPRDTQFIAAQHNTTTDEVVLYVGDDKSRVTHLDKLRHDLALAGEINNRWRGNHMGYSTFRGDGHEYVAHMQNRSADWAQVRPEWGLARNAAFIIGPRSMTQGIHLEGRAFLHSYDWEQDRDGKSLTTILTAPMVVGQWINSQYLFSTLDNVAYGSGSKITHNITGKMGIMQGNASDLMHGLPLQSIASSDEDYFHKPLRLLTIVYAPRSMISHIISQHAILQRLFGNSWVLLACIDPIDGKFYDLQSDLTWKIRM